MPTASAHFVKSSITRRSSQTLLQPFNEDGYLNGEVTERRCFVYNILQIDRRPRCFLDGRRNQSNCEVELLCSDDFRDRGFAVGSIRELCMNKGVPRKVPMGVFTGEDEGRQEQIARSIREVAEEFWTNRSYGQELCRRRFGCDAEGCIIVPTHVTFRAVPPNGMSLAHIDYDQNMPLETLATEWWGRWKGYFEDRNSSSPAEISAKFDLIGVVTLWICLQWEDNGVIQNYPLLVGDATSVKDDDKVVYSVGTKHSVGVIYNENIRWYHSPGMVWGDVWAFDTRCTPHVAADLDPPVEAKAKGFVRHSAEVRSLILRRKGSPT